MTVKKHLLVTNDFPPKVGGIQNYLYELYKRLPCDSFVVYTTPYEGSEKFDAEQEFKIIRSKEPWISSYPWMPRRINNICDLYNLERVIIDPAWPLGSIGTKIDREYGVILHGAELCIPAKFPLIKQRIRKTLRNSGLVISAGQYPLDAAIQCAGKDLNSVVITPGVDVSRFNPVDAAKKEQFRKQFGVKDTEILISAVSRLVPRKGFSNLVEAVNNLKTQFDIKLLIAGSGRMEKKLKRQISNLSAPVELLGRISDDQVHELYSCSDLMAMICNERWFGLEQEGFGIVFLEGAASGVAQLAGRSGGSHEAVEDGVSGLIVEDPDSIAEITNKLSLLCSNSQLRSDLASSWPQRSEQFCYDNLAAKLEATLLNW